MPLYDAATTPVGRRALVRTAVWTVPVVATAAAAPSFAASCGSLSAGYLDWSANYTRNSTTSGVASVPIAGGAALGLTVASQFTNYTAQDDNLAATGAQIGGTGKPGVTIAQAVNAASFTNKPANSQLLTFTFSRKVYGLTFTMTDIDLYAADFIDSVAVTADGTYSVTKGSNVTGTGATTTPLVPTSSATNQDDTTGALGNVKFTFSSAVTTINIKYWNSLTGPITNYDGAQAIYLGPFTFQTYLTSGC